MNLNRLAGVVLVVVGVLIGVLAVAWVFTNSDLEVPARILGLALALMVLVAPLVGAGVYLLAFGGQQAREQAEAARQRKLLNMVQTRGQVRLDDIALELQLPRDQIKNLVYDLVGLGVFSGYVKWDEGVLYSSDAQHLRQLQKCPNCGGEITLSGKGVASCRFCGTEFFLS